MEAFVQVLLGVTMIAVVVVLFTGIISFIAGGEFNRKYANKLMRARVAAQAVAVVLLLVLLIMRGFVSFAQ
jgi:hypothetical protein